MISNRLLLHRPLFTDYTLAMRLYSSFALTCHVIPLHSHTSSHAHFQHCSSSSLHWPSHTPSNHHQCIRFASSSNPKSALGRQAKRLEKLGIGPDGKPLPMPNYKRIHPRLYKVLMVNQDGSTYYINHGYPYKIITLPLDLTTLSPEQLEERERKKAASKVKVYHEEEGLEEEEESWDQLRYRDL